MEPTNVRPHVVIVGGGISGLAAAFFLRDEAVRVTVLEGSPRLGGKLSVSGVAGVAVDEGAEALLVTRPEGTALIAEAGLGDQRTDPGPTSSAIWTLGALRPLPRRQFMGVPSDMAELARSGVLSADGVARAGQDLELPPTARDGDVSVAPKTVSGTPNGPLGLGRYDGASYRPTSRRRRRTGDGHRIVAECLCDQAAVNKWFAAKRPQVVFLAAAKVGGIVANNTLRAEFLYDNLAIAANVIHAAHLNRCEKLMFLGSSCIYPKLATQPLREDSMLTGPLEPTNEPYAIAKIAGIKMAETYRSQYGSDFISVMPTNLYGPGDNYHAEDSHVIPALIRRFHEARAGGASAVVIWGTGTPRREFLYVDDMAEASLHVMQLDKAAYDANTQPMLSHINVGTGEDITIAELARLVGKIVGFAGRIDYDPSKPDGAPRKLMDAGRIRALGWRPRVGLEDGLALAYRDFLTSERR